MCKIYTDFIIVLEKQLLQDEKLLMRLLRILLQPLMNVIMYQQERHLLELTHSMTLEFEEELNLLQTQFHQRLVLSVQQHEQIMLELQREQMPQVLLQHLIQLIENLLQKLLEEDMIPHKQLMVYNQSQWVEQSRKNLEQSREQYKLLNKKLQRKKDLLRKQHIKKQQLLQDKILQMNDMLYEDNEDLHKMLAHKQELQQFLSQLPKLHDMRKDDQRVLVHMLLTM